MEKLIRDNYTRMIEPERLSFSICDNHKFKLLQEKILEEIEELSLSEYEDINEWGDVIETLFAMLSFKGIDIRDVERARINKKLDLGGFNSFLVLKS